LIVIPIEFGKQPVSQIQLSPGLNRLIVKRALPQLDFQHIIANTIIRVIDIKMALAGCPKKTVDAQQYL